VEKNDDDEHWIPEAIEEAADGIAKIAPILQANAIGAILTLLMILGIGFCIERLILAARSPIPQLHQRRLGDR